MLRPRHDADLDRVLRANEGTDTDMNRGDKPCERRAARTRDIKFNVRLIDRTEICRQKQRGATLAHGRFAIKLLNATS